MIDISLEQMYNGKNVTLFEKINAFLWKLWIFLLGGSK